MTVRFYYCWGGSLLCEKQLLPHWKRATADEDTESSYYPHPAPADCPPELFFVAESMDTATARLIAKALGGELEET